MTTDIRTPITRRRFMVGASALAAAGLLAACSSNDEPELSASGPGGAGGGLESTDASTGGGDEIGPDGHFGEIQIANNGTPFLIPLDEIRAGGPPKDGIPSIDEPQFVGSSDWEGQRLREDMLVLGRRGQRQATGLSLPDHGVA